MDAPEGTFIDHKDGNTLNNTKENLRLCTKAQNQQNRSGIRKDKLKGAFKVKNSLWRCRIRASGRNIHIGYYRTEEEAHAAYMEAAKKYHGEFAHA